MSTSMAGEVQIAPQAGLLVRLNVWLRPRLLDEAMALGTPPETSPPLALRARRQTAMARRRAIADGLRRLLRDANSPMAPSRNRVAVRRAQIAAARHELNQLAYELASPGPLAPRGVAQAWILLTDGTGPLYNEKSTANVRACAARALENLRLET